MRRRPPVKRPAASRRWLDTELGALRRAPADPAAWWRFAARCVDRSLEQCRLHPRAARSLAAAHLALFALAPGPWVALSFAYCATHLGLLGNDDRLGPADLVSLVRANLPAILPRSRWSVPVAVVSDGLDGWLARRTRQETAFGAYLDGLADVAFWTWFSAKRERNPVIRSFALAFWTLPAIAITATYFAAGRSIDYPRLTLVRRASAVFQVTLALRAVTSITVPSARDTPR